MTQFYNIQRPPAQGFYNPYMPTPDYAAGVRQMVADITERERYKERIGMEERELEQEQEKIDISRLSAEAYKQYVEQQGKPTMPDWVQKGMTLYQMFPDDYETPGHAIKQVLKIKDDEVIPSTVDPTFEQTRLIPMFGENWREELTPQRFWDEQKEFNLRTRPVKTKITTEEDYRKAIAQTKNDWEEMMSRARIRLIESEASDIMAQYGLGNAAQGYEQARDKLEEEGQRLLSEIISNINTQFMKQGAGEEPTYEDVREVKEGVNKGTWGKIKGKDEWVKIK